MYRTIGLITANFDFGGFGALTEERPAVSIPFGGRYRLMDFALSNMVNARIQTVGMITPYRYRSIIDHIGAGKEWDLDRKSGGLYIMPGTVYGFRESDGRFLFRDFQTNIRFFETDADYVLVSSGALVCNIDYTHMLDRHDLAGRGVTLLCRRTNPGESQRGYYLTLTENGIVSDIAADDGGEYLFLDCFIINRSLLLRLTRDFSNLGQMDIIEILRLAMNSITVGSYLFEGYVARMSNASDYLRSSMELLNRSVRRELFDRERQIRTKVHDTPPALYTSGSSVKDSLVAAGCIIEGTVQNSVLFRSVKVEKGAVVKNCVLMEKTVIKSGAVLENVICDRSVTITADTRIQGTCESPCVLPKGRVI